MILFLKKILFGFLVWIIPFAISIIVWPINSTLPALFKSIMIVVGMASGLGFTIFYFKKIESNFLSEGIITGFIWLVLNLLLDVIFLIILFKMNVKDYFLGVGLVYLTMPILTTGVGLLLKIKNMKK